MVDHSRVNRLQNGWIQVKVPLPFALKWVNAYLVPSSEGWTVIDPGLRTEETTTYWTEILREFKICATDIKQIVLTHHHPDHYGMAGWFQELADGAPVYMSQVARDAAMRLWDEQETFSDELTEAFLQHGMDPSLKGDMLEHMRSFRERVSPHPELVNFIAVGSTIQMGDISWLAIGGEGHAPGHLSFYDSSSKQLICGDQVLPDISPNIGWMPGGDPNPLRAFLASLNNMSSLDVSTAYPGHRDPFTSFQSRIEQLLEHHEQRLVKMIELMGDDTVTAFELCERLFSNRLGSNAHQLRFALAETIAHLIELEQRKLIVREQANDRLTIKYVKAKAYK
ncbi:MAG: MBL fold metallo-hydrolase [Candidatus Cohnella colombiensis]|uniref:MBL fold metallo-hydrolase n=1 Tax=Candidatus Cohnella colombiensis TaxID=3121368 RepID=A0AA95JGI9_9BACL|nr:MAG: MBL fold metallo-hydrolase [Cohnella sp.]